MNMQNDMVLKNNEGNADIIVNLNLKKQFLLFFNTHNNK